MLSFLPIVFFIVQIVKYTYIESQEIFYFLCGRFIYLCGLFHNDTFLFYKK